MYSPSYINYELLKERMHYFQENEVALHHWNNGSTIRICDDGCLDIFANKTTGLRIDPYLESPSVSLFAQKINLLSKKTSIYTNPNKLMWNKWLFNSSIYEWCKNAPMQSDVSPRKFRAKFDYEIWTEEDKWEHVDILMPPYIKDKEQERFSNFILDTIKGLGINID